MSSFPTVYEYILAIPGTMPKNRCGTTGTHHFKSPFHLIKFLAFFLFSNRLMYQAALDTLGQKKSGYL